MRSQNRTILFSAVLMLMLILDTATMVQGAKDGVLLCIQTVVPALFPFFVISGVLNSGLNGISIPGFGLIRRLCRIPRGADSIFLLGILGGYPVGAKCIAEAYESGAISKNNGRRMLGFCSNCGPSFIFGICSSLFTVSGASAALWIIQILSAMITGYFLPGECSTNEVHLTGKPATITASLKTSIKTMAEVCGWVILFRVIIQMLRKWLIWLLPEYVSMLMFGVLELTNGCIMLSNICFEPLRFVVCSVILSFGGLCVMMQTVSVTASCGLGLYIPGKIVQTFFSAALSVIVSFFLYFGSVSTLWPVISALTILLAGFGAAIIKKDSIQKKSVV